MNIIKYEPTYTDYSTLDKVPDEVIKMFGVEDDSKILNMVPSEVALKIAEIKYQKQQAIKIREYFKSKEIEKSSFI